ncbi:hypothetical protein [Nocardia blacklockiae]|uniref:hypothetical protein n=1 Tax=Nocardia blacklockiae TaxID=480036 RepID=UPI0018949B0E|nr:hypothetical protein [Nocardia blacklockiae]MBF6175965.1 hypothetical protein [Nocardia blacklockiae]
MADRDDSYSSHGKGPREVGDWFRDGMAHLRGHTEANGWRKELRLDVPGFKGPRILDNALPGPGKRVREATEYKSGRIRAKTAIPQLLKERELLARGRIDYKEWVIVRGQRVDPAVRALMDRMEKQFKGRFKVVEDSKAERLRAIRVGQELARNRLLQQKREVARWLTRVRAERERSDRAVQRARDEREAHRQQRERLQKEAARQVAREFAQRFGHVLRAQGQGDSGRGRDTPDTVENARRREVADAATEKARKGREAAEEAARKHQRDAADRLAKTAQEARELAAKGERGDMAREVADLLRVTRPTPGIEPPSRDAIAAARTRTGRVERGRERGIEPRGR